MFAFAGDTSSIHERNVAWLYFVPILVVPIMFGLRVCDRATNRLTCTEEKE
jgi:hypothetical protein